MKKLFLLLLMATPCYAAFPTHSNIVTSDVSKIKGYWDSFSWKWAGYNSQTNTILVKDGSTWLDLDAYYINTKISRYSNTSLVTYVSSTNITVTDSNVTWTIAYSNIPPNGDYLCEGFVYDSSPTSLTRTVWQGKITVFNSIYGEDDSQYPWTSVTNLIEYLKIVTFASYTTDVATTTGSLQSQITSNDADIALGVTNIINGGTSGTTGQVSRSGKDVTVTFPSPSAADYAAVSGVSSGLVSSYNITNPIAAMPAISLTNSATQGAAAYAWGNHAAQGYLKSGSNVSVLVNDAGYVSTNALATATNAAIIEATNRVAAVGYLLPVSTQGLATITYVDTATNAAIIEATNRVAAVGYLLPVSTQALASITYVDTATNAAIIEATNRVAGVGYLLPVSTQGLASISYVDTATNAAIIEATNRIAGVGYLLPASTQGLVTASVTNNCITTLDSSGCGITTNGQARTLGADWTGTLDGQEGDYYRSAANHTNRLASIVLGPITTNASPDNYVVMGPIPYAFTITNVCAYGDGGTWAGDLWLSNRTNIIAGRTIISTGITYTVGTLVTNISPATTAISAAQWIGFVLTNGASPTNAWVSVEGRY